jgi:hypothetical protein
MACPGNGTGVAQEARGAKASGARWEVSWGQGTRRQERGGGLLRGSMSNKKDHMREQNEGAYADGWAAGCDFAAKATPEVLREFGGLHRERSKPLPAKLGFVLRLTALLAGTDAPDADRYLARAASAFERAVAHIQSLPPGAAANDRKAATLLSVLESAGDAVAAYAKDAGVTREPDDEKPCEVDSVYARDFMDAIHDAFDRLEN